jgi:hypothetical protein
MIITEDTPRGLSPTVGEKSPGNSPWAFLKSFKLIRFFKVCRGGVYGVSPPRRRLRKKNNFYHQKFFLAKMDGPNEVSQENSSLSPGEKLKTEKFKIEFWPKKSK